LERKLVSPPPLSLTAEESPVAKTADVERAIPESPESSAPDPAARGEMVDASSAEPPVIVEPSASSASGVEGEIPPPFLESPTPDAAAPEGDWIAAEPDPSEPEPVRDGESASLPEADDAIAGSLPDSPDQDAATAAEPPAAAMTDEVVGRPPSARAQSKATPEPVADRKPPPRRTRATATSRSQPQKASPQKPKSRSIVVTPPEWRNQSRARARRDPWQPPTDTGFNQK
jgi:hypothetical protein